MSRVPCLVSMDDFGVVFYHEGKSLDLNPGVG